MPSVDDILATVALQPGQPRRRSLSCRSNATGLDFDFRHITELVTMLARHFVIEWDSVDRHYQLEEVEEETTLCLEIQKHRSFEQWRE